MPKLPEKDQEKFFLLTDSVTKNENGETTDKTLNGPKTAFGIFKTNACGTGDGKVGIFPTIARINHSCVPNMRHTNLIRQLERGELQGEHQGEIVVMQLEAQRTILPNTELTIRYNDYMTVRLKYYCFVLVLALGDIPLISTEKLKCILFHF